MSSRRPQCLPPVQGRLIATQFVRKLRGRSQAHLLRAEDGRHYVTKFSNNPQGINTVINEIVSTGLLHRLGVLVPSLAFLELPTAWGDGTPEIGVQQGPRWERPAPGWHLGSLYPGDPDTIAVYDFLPDALLAQVCNLADGVATLVFDFWTGHAGRRQALFTRQRVGDWLPHRQEHQLKQGLLVFQIDHGLTCGGAAWNFACQTLPLHPERKIYETITGWRDLEATVEQIASLQASDFDQVMKRVPPRWLVQTDSDAFDWMLDTLYRRRLALADCLRHFLAAHPAVLPRYQASVRCAGFPLANVSGVPPVSAEGTGQRQEAGESDGAHNG